MIKEYTIDERERSRIISTQYKKHPRWKRTTWFRYLCVIISVMLFTIGVYILIAKPIENSGSYAFHIIVSPSYVGCIYLGYIRLMQLKNDDTVSFKENEKLILTDVGIENSYRPGDEGIKETRDVNKIAYKDIKRIEYNKHHNRLTVFGVIQWRRYWDYEKKELQFNDRENDGRSFYLYYNDNEDFIKTLVEKSKVELEVVDYPEEFKWVKQE